MKLLEVRKIALGAFFGLVLINPTFSQSMTKDSWGKGVRVEAQDSSFTLKFGFRFQTLYQGTLNNVTNDWTNSFLVRRARLKFDGYAFSPKFQYKVEIALSNRETKSGASSQFGNTANAMLDAVLKYNFAPNWSLWMGQTKLPGNRERVVSSQKLQFVDRSLVNSRFTLDRDVGFQLRHKSKSGKMVMNQTFAISMGNGRNVIVDDNEGYEYTGRLEFLPMGNFKSKGDYFESDLSREPKPKLAIGITGDFNDNAIRSRGNLGGFVTDVEGNYVSNDLYALHVDGIFKHKGFSIMSEYINRGEEVASSQFGTGQGLVFQASYLTMKNVEIAGRYTTIDPNAMSSLKDQTEYTIGLSKYVVGHSLKFQTDLSYNDLPNADNYYRFRFQFEVAL